MSPTPADQSAPPAFPCLHIASDPLPPPDSMPQPAPMPLPTPQPPQVPTPEPPSSPPPSISFASDSTYASPSPSHLPSPLVLAPLPPTFPHILTRSQTGSLKPKTFPDFKLDN